MRLDDYLTAPASRNENPICIMKTMMPMMTRKKESVLNISTFKLSSKAATVAFEVDMLVAIFSLEDILLTVTLSRTAKALQLDKS